MSGCELMGEELLSYSWPLACRLFVQVGVEDTDLVNELVESLLMASSQGELLP